MIVGEHAGHSRYIVWFNIVAALLQRQTAAIDRLENHVESCEKHDNTCAVNEIADDADTNESFVGQGNCGSAGVLSGCRSLCKRLFVSQRDHGIDACRAARWKIASQNGRRSQH
jgi:hypothetical protein